ncbi:hypothetical protein DDQ41_00185 [Streptomyces spongiicola]|uniref:AMP-dependent synthetase/ligase domain-containing protein n=1 Tax=Streptomyces spongiicola TaxID=1690221 RepID=A0ABM6V0R9_9ACTN|nr:class I adenylate-forming enzyme family protein [Streptomyces spongiicola]AWK07602.1 hypothetical protein DDQ41_00185 [Streptomyces spongiicola]
MPVSDLFARARAERAGHPAVVAPDGSLSYRELGTRVDRAVGWLRAHGVTGGARVVYAGGNDGAFLALFHATLRVGAVFVPVHPELTDAQVDHIVGDCGAALAVCTPTAGRRARRTVEVDRARGEIQDSPPDCFAGAVSDDDVALLVYTSGTTGRPKGVVCPHRQVLAAVRAVDACLGYRADDVVLCRLPLSFDYGLYQALLCAQAGSTLVLVERGGDRALLSAIERHGVTIVPLVPSLAQMLTLLQRRLRRPTGVRLFTNTGARPGRAVVSELLELFPGSVFASMYGMTECQRISVLDPVLYAAHPDSVGRPIPGDHVRVTGADGCALGPGEVGEIVVWGSTVMDGYWGVPPEDQNRYVRRPDGSLELHTGDRGYLDAAGLLYFVGRDDDMIKRRGVRMGLTEIEDAAERIPGVTAAVALRPEHEDGALRLAVQTSHSPEEVRRRLARLLDRARLPDRIIPIPSVPLTANGKPDREAVRRLCAAPARDHDTTAPSSAQTRTPHEPAAV